MRSAKEEEKKLLSSLEPAKTSGTDTLAASGASEEASADAQAGFSTQLSPLDAAGQQARNAYGGMDAILRKADPAAFTDKDGKTPAAASPEKDEKAGDQDSEKAAAEAEAKKKEAKRIALAKAKWEDLFGQSIGGKLFDKVHDLVSVDKLNGYADKGIEAMAKSLGGLVKKTDEGALGGLMDEDKEAEAVKKMADALAPVVQKLAADWVDSDQGQKVLAAVTGWVEGNPAWVTTIVGTAAISAAVAVILTDMDVPEFGTKFKLAKGLTASGSIDLGPIQSWTVKAASAALEYSTSGFAASLKYSTKEEGGATSHTVAASVKGQAGDDTSFSGAGDVTVKDDGTTAVKVTGGLGAKLGGTPVNAEAGYTQSASSGKTDKQEYSGAISVGEKGEQVSAKGSYDASSETLTFGVERTALEGAFRQGQKVSSGQDGTTFTQETAYKGKDTELKVTEQQGAKGEGAQVEVKSSDLGNGLSGSASFGTGAMAGGAVGLSFKKDEFESNLNLMMKDTVSTLGLDTKIKTEGGTTASADIKIDLTDKRVTELGLSYGWKDPAEFKAFLVNYKLSWVEQNKLYKHHFDAALEYSLGQMLGRATAGIDVTGNQVTSATAGGVVGYKINQDVTALGGYNYTAKQDGQGAFNGTHTLQLGVQYKNVPLMVGYQPQTNTWSVGLTLPLGR